MLRVERHADPGSVPCDALKLAYDDRKKSRLRVWSEARREVGIFLAWGSVLRDGDLLAANSGEVFVVRAAPEPLSEVRTRDWHLLTRAAYHLGNRHVPLQIEPGILRYQRDHVLDEMLVGLGLQVSAVEASFEPEAGAYAGGHSHAHGVLSESIAHPHDHSAAHSHSHDHSAVHSHEPGRPHSHSHPHGNEDAQSHGNVQVHEHTGSPSHDHAGPPTQPATPESNLKELLHRSRNS